MRKSIKCSCPDCNNRDKKECRLCPQNKWLGLQECNWCGRKLREVA
jgi:hypothetical protein